MSTRLATLLSAGLLIAGPTFAATPARPNVVFVLADEAHRLRGAAGMYGYPELTEVAGRVEDAARAGEGETALAPLLAGLAALVDRARLGLPTEQPAEAD